MPILGYTLPAMFYLKLDQEKHGSKCSLMRVVAYLIWVSFFASSFMSIVLVVYNKFI